MKLPIICWQIIGSKSLIWQKYDPNRWYSEYENTFVTEEHFDDKRILNNYKIDHAIIDDEDEEIQEKYRKHHNVISIDSNDNDNEIEEKHKKRHYVINLDEDN